MIIWAGGVLSAGSCALGFPSASSIDYRGIPARAACLQDRARYAFILPHRGSPRSLSFGEKLCGALRSVLVATRRRRKNIPLLGRYHMISIPCGPWGSSTVVRSFRASQLAEIM